LMKVGGAALAVTLVTFFAFPESYIFFGILHAIAVSSVLALPFLRLHPVLSLIAAAFFLAGPSLFTSPALDAPWLDWLGLGASDPVTNDYVPLFPWFGLTLIGVAACKMLLPLKDARKLGHWRARGPLSKTLIWAGRKSLPIYLIHQIVLLAALYGVLQMVGPNPAAEARPFREECERSCLAQGAQIQTCRAICSCTITQMRGNDLWQKFLANTLTLEDQTRISRTAQQCLREVPPS
jgi:uncharacterized membrane protein